MAKGELNKDLGIVGGLHDVFNRMARECDSDVAKPLFQQTAQRFEHLARCALSGTFGKAAGRDQSLQQALDHVFEPMGRLSELSHGNPALDGIWQEARSVIESFEEPVVAALKNCQRVAPDKPIDLLHPIKFRFRPQPSFA